MGALRAAGLLCLAAVTLIVVFVRAPASLAAARPVGGTGTGFADQASLIRAVDGGFAGYWRSGRVALTPAFGDLAGYWSRYQAVKAVSAALLLAVLFALARMLWRAWCAELRPGRRGALAASGALTTGFGVFALLVLMATVQATAAPLSSLMSMVSTGATSGPVAVALGQARAGLSTEPDGAPAAPALRVLTDDFARYHYVLVLLASLLALSMFAAAVMTWRRRRRVSGPLDATARRTRRVLTWFSALALTLALAAVLLAAVNLSVATNPAPALLAFLQGSM